MGFQHINIIKVIVDKEHIKSAQSNHQFGVVEAGVNELLEFGLVCLVQGVPVIIDFVNGPEGGNPSPVCV